VCQSCALPGTIIVKDDNSKITNLEAIDIPHTTRGCSTACVPGDAENNPGQPDNETLGQSDNSGSEAESGCAKKQKWKKKDKGKGVDWRPGYEKSEYEKERDANIARNKAILVKLNAEWEEHLKLPAKGDKRVAKKVGEPSGVPCDPVSSARSVDL
jgi:hypothetical protein